MECADRKNEVDDEFWVFELKSKLLIRRTRVERKPKESSFEGVAQPEMTR
jgi:hypothetical protein